jgi:hypothetical protein
VMSFSTFDSKTAFPFSAILPLSVLNALKITVNCKLKNRTLFVFVNLNLFPTIFIILVLYSIQKCGKMYGIVETAILNLKHIQFISQRKINVTSCSISKCQDTIIFLWSISSYQGQTLLTRWSQGKQVPPNETFLQETYLH